MNKTTIPTLIVLGSGGHTTEIFRLLSGIDLNVYKPRYYTIASTDKMSAKKMNEFEQNVSICFRRYTFVQMKIVI
jgi:beta-1,4-N-acetylglucosaminyltransferase